MKKRIFIVLVASFMLFCLTEVEAQFKVHSDGRVSFQSTTPTWGVQIDPIGRSSFEPNISTSGSNLTQTKVLTQYVKAWNVKNTGNPVVSPEDRFYVTGLGDAYAHSHYTISSGGGGGTTKGTYPIENASKMLSGLNGYYYDNHDFEGFEPDFINNPNIAPEAIEGLMKDIAIDKTLGLSAEDLESVLPEAIRHDPEGMVYINYSAIIPILVEAFKEQQNTIDLLQKEIADLKNNDKVYSELENPQNTRNILFQNSPNPTKSSTTIECYLDLYSPNAIIAVYDLNGLQLKEYPIYHQGRNTVFIEANEFLPGIYLYSFLVDGKMIDTKRMVITSK